MSAKVPKPASRTRTHVVTAGSTIRIEEPESSREQKHNIATFVVQDINPVGGFLEFLREHAVVGLAIGFIIGLQAQTLVKQLVDSFINPLISLLFGKGLKERVFTLHFHSNGSPFYWGAFAYAIVNFIFVLAAIYAIVKIFNLDKLEKPVEKIEEVEQHQEKE